MYPTDTPAPAPQPINWGKVFLWSATALAAWKGYQCLTDEDYGDGEYPRNVRHDLIDGHVEAEGCHCTMCDRPTQRRDLTVDHIYPMSKGGRTSLNNAQVICRSCNSSKGNRMTLGDRLRGVRA